MGDTWITDITHFLDEDGRLPDGIPKEARNLAEFLGSIISVETTTESEVEDEPFVNCRRRPRRRPCSGEILHMIDRQSKSNRIMWHCTVCDDNGYISNWQGTMWDNTDMGSTH